MIGIFTHEGGDVVLRLRRFFAGVLWNQEEWMRCGF